MNEGPVAKPRRRKSFSVPRVILGVLIGILVLAELFLVRPGRHPSKSFTCQANLMRLGFGLHIYSERHGAFPPADKWCDLLVEAAADQEGSERIFKCPMGGKGRCDYAMNPRADAQSAPDVVLLFESTGGWNQAGGPELLTTKHHEDKGCNVLFVGGYVTFVKTEEIPTLRWEGQESAGDEAGKQGSR